MSIYPKIKPVLLSEASFRIINAPHPAPTIFVGDCIDTRHPTLKGRVRIRWKDNEDLTREKWLPCLHGLTIRQADRVLVEQPSNWPEPIVIGVVDGFATRPEYRHVPGPSVVLEKDESLRVYSSDGQPMLEIYQEKRGPVVRLLTDDMNLDLKGRLKIDARSIEIAAKQGGIKIVATDDVVVQGEMIKMN
jgi:hypothetical protein